MKHEYLRVFRAFSDEKRLSILELLCEGEQCACVLLENIKLSQPTLSHHMKILCQSGIVTCRRVGKWNYYSINAAGCQYGSQLLEMLAHHKIDTTVRILRLCYRLLHPFKKSTLPPVEQNCCCGNHN